MYLGAAVSSTICMAVAVEATKPGMFWKTIGRSTRPDATRPLSRPAAGETRRLVAQNWILGGKGSSVPATVRWLPLRSRNSSR